MPLPKIVRTIFSSRHLIFENQFLKQQFSSQHVENDCLFVFLCAGGKRGATSGARREGKIMIHASLLDLGFPVKLGFPE